MSFLTPYERQARNTRRLTYMLAALFLATLFGVIAHYFGLSIALLLCSPVIGGYGAWLLVNHGSKSYKGLRWLALNKVNGKFHAFSDIEVQVEWSDGQCEVAAKDVSTSCKKSQMRKPCVALVFASVSGDSFRMMLECGGLVKRRSWNG